MRQSTRITTTWPSRPIDAPNARRAATALECERVAFTGGRGICLQASRGILTTFGAVVFDDTFHQLHALKLDGSPSRTRISPDGRLGAITVFVTGQEHGYSAGSFSTKTTIMDRTTGAVLGDLEQVATTRGGQPFKAPTSISGVSRLPTTAATSSRR